MDEIDPEPTEILTGDLPEDFREVLMRYFNDYSVAIARARNNDARTFTPLGSGVLVSRKNQFGILTAHHCLHGVKPEVQLGTSNGDSLMLILRGGRQIVIDPTEIREVPLAYPSNSTYGEFGPDLTFIQIVHPERLSTIRAIGSFWNLDKDPNQIEAEFAHSKTPIVSIGYPGFEYDTEIKSNDVHHKVKHMAYPNAIGDGDIIQNGVWDYVDVKFVHTGQPDLPTDIDLRGVSGGPVWAYEMQISRETGRFSVGKFALVGIQFWGTDMVGDSRSIRAHFIRSIYDLAWSQYC